MFNQGDLDQAMEIRNGTREILNEKFEALGNARDGLEQADAEYQEAKENAAQAGEEAYSIMREIEQNET